MRALDVLLVSTAPVHDAPRLMDDPAQHPVRGR